MIGNIPFTCIWSVEKRFYSKFKKNIYGYFSKATPSAGLRAARERQDGQGSAIRQFMYGMGRAARSNKTDRIKRR